MIEPLFSFTGLTYVQPFLLMKSKLFLAFPIRVHLMIESNNYE